MSEILPFGIVAAPAAIAGHIQQPKRLYIEVTDDVRRVLNEAEAALDALRNPKIVGVACRYFKESGKYYLEGVAQFDSAVFEGCIYPREYGQRLRERKELPGLASGTWDYYFTIDVKHKYEELVLPI